VAGARNGCTETQGDGGGMASACFRRTLRQPSRPAMTSSCVAWANRSGPRSSRTCGPVAADECDLRRGHHAQAPRREARSLMKRSSWSRSA